jgi:hypothetical protein
MLPDEFLQAMESMPYETSMFWYLYPELTRMDRFQMETSKKMLYPSAS